MKVPNKAPHSTVTVDDLDDACYATPWFWLAPRFHVGWPEGFQGSYLTNGGRATEGHFVRFTPDLAAGTYQVSFSDQTPFRLSERIEPDVRFAVRVRHKHGSELVRVEPHRSRSIGTFAFEEGTDGYVEILAGGAEGHVVADAVVFQTKGP